MNFHRQLELENQRIVHEGGLPLSNEDTDRILSLLEDVSFHPDPYRNAHLKEVQKIVDLHRRITVPSERKKWSSEKRPALMKTSRFTVLRQKIGLPFKSRRQP
jgi:hypothetical protein